MLVKDAARIAAENALAEHWNGKFPVDPVAIAEGFDITVWLDALDDDISGAIVADGEKVQIFLAEDEPFERQTFTCAHEIGHYLERTAARDDDYSFKDTRSPHGYDLHEFYADEFAGNLLMPAEKFVELYEQGMSTSLLADFFGVSRPAVRKRVERLRNDGRLG
ncbi:ImmA/IrrE family metallo-endopeptidase [Leifsonia aquatica]|uniref:ImmA/IrrE family metallo-endopeptidase n=1 Tax=Leifsonia aquatica TaxID=144185 RepID=UPI00046A2645|nr:ImmA/IrrE family metallo-endopeptidase [Leifsonia aquatica]